MNKIPTYELFLEDNEQIGLALVKNPAIETDFIYFSDENIKVEFNSEQMIVKGPALIPNKKIYRNDSIGERYVFLSENTIQKFAEYLINKQGTKFNLGHTDNIIEANLIESYFTTEINDFNIPKGSWIVSLKIKSIEAWEQVKKGEFKGFSIEGIFSNELSKFTEINNNKKEQQEKMNLKEKLQNAINAVLFNETPEVEIELVSTPVVVPPVEETNGNPDEVKEPVGVPEPMTEEEVQSMIDASILVATEQIIQSVKDLLSQGSQDTATAMSKMEEKLEEFSKQPLSTPITETVVNTAKLSSDYAYLSGINK